MSEAQPSYRDGWEEMSREEDIETSTIKKRGSSGRMDFLGQHPYNMREWVNTVGEHVREQVDLGQFDDDDPLVEMSVDRVSYVDPETNDFDVVYEGRWEWVDGVGPGGDDD